MSDKIVVPEWFYNEFQASGVDYADLEVARGFERRHRRFRDFDREFERIVSRSGLNHDSVVLDLGCGSGAFVIPAARYCKEVYAADVSQNMLTILKEKVEQEKLANVSLFNAGLLTFWQEEKRSRQFDFIISSISLHHLPDFWKAVAIQKIADALRPGGIFYLFDVVFTFPVSDWYNGVTRVLNEMEASAGHEASQHISSEFSSFSWYLEGLFKRVGLEIEKVYDDSGFLRTYVCRKPVVHETFHLTSAESHAVDRNALSLLKIPTLLLMENAARSLADIFTERAPRFNAGRKPERILICCGKGNNGGDGFALFRRLQLLGYDARLVTLAPFGAYQGDALTNLQIVRATTQDSPHKLLYFDGSPESIRMFTEELEWSDWVVDALLGTGSKGALRAPYDQVIPMINSSGKPIYAVDIPSGVDPDDGSVASEAIRATLTTTLGAAKTGLLAENARSFVGELHVGDIGVSIAPLVEKLGSGANDVQ